MDIASSALFPEAFAVSAMSFSWFVTGDSITPDAADNLRGLRQCLLRESRDGENRMTKRYFEDFKAGDSFKGDSIDVTQDTIVRFARAFDPQPFHLDPQAARQTMFGELVASGWHTAAMTMRLFATSEIQIANGIVGGGVEQLSWPRPVRPGDRLTVRIEVLEAHPSKSKPDRGMLKVRVDTLNQDGAVVQSFIGKLVVLRRAAA
jgi:acyl dehydratase